MSNVKEGYFAHPGWEILFWIGEVAIITAFCIGTTVNGGKFTSDFN